MEHTMYCSTTELWNIAADRGLTSNTEAKKQTWDKNFRSWNFSQKDLSSTSGELVKQFSFDFWGYKDYSVTWKYDAQSNRYLRVNGGLDQIDFNSDEQLSAKNIIIQFTKETRSVDTHGHNLYDMVGTGKGLLFQNGTKTDITWSKANRTSRTLFKDKSGKEVALVPGQTWVEVLAQTVVINYENIQ
jgi:hypothetical protein